MRLDGLTPQQHRVACLVADGKTDKEIATELRIGKQGVRFHIRRIALAFGLKGGNTRVHIARHVLKVPLEPAA